MELPDTPAAYRCTRMQQHLQEPDQTNLVNLDARIANATHRNWQGEPLQQGEVDVGIEADGPVSYTHLDVYKRQT